MTVQNLDVNKARTLPNRSAYSSDELYYEMVRITDRYDERLKDLENYIESFSIPHYTTTERDALSAINGRMIYNTTTGRLEVYQSGAWYYIGGQV